MRGDRDHAGARSARPRPRSADASRSAAAAPRPTGLSANAISDAIASGGERARDRADEPDRDRRGSRTRSAIGIAERGIEVDASAVGCSARAGIDRSEGPSESASRRYRTSDDRRIRGSPVNGVTGACLRRARVGALRARGHVRCSRSRCLMLEIVRHSERVIAWVLVAAAIAALVYPGGRVRLAHSAVHAALRSCCSS